MHTNNIFLFIPEVQHKCEMSFVKLSNSSMACLNVYLKLPKSGINKTQTKE